MCATSLSLQKDSRTSTRELIEKSLKSKHPATVEQLAQIVLSGKPAEETDFVATVKSMAKDGSIVLQAPSYEIESVLDFLLTLTLSGWFWLAISVTALAMTVVTLIPDLFPINALKWIFGSVLVLYLPGYGLSRLLFPRSSEFDELERFALSVGLSLATVPLIGLMLNYTPWGINSVPIALSLGMLSTASIVVAASRQYLSSLNKVDNTSVEI